jgi:hypothetical protein
MMALREIKESPHDTAWGWEEMERLLTIVDSLPDLVSLPIESGSIFQVDAQIENYDPPADQVIFLVGVARDHLDAFRSMLVKPNGGLPAMAGYTLLRATIEAASTAIWLRCSNKANTRVMRSLWMIVHSRDDVAGLAAKLQIENTAGYERMKARVDGIISGRKGLLASSLSRRYTKTDMINEADKHVPRRKLSCLEAWQACSGITHSNRNSVLMLLEREALETVGTRTTFSMTASALVTAEVLSIAVACLTTASEIFVTHSTASPRR